MLGRLQQTMAMRAKTLLKAITTEKVAVPKTSKMRGPRGPYKKNPNNSFLTQLNYYIIISKLL